MRMPAPPPPLLGIIIAAAELLVSMMPKLVAARDVKGPNLLAFGGVQRCRRIGLGRSANCAA